MGKKANTRKQPNAPELQEYLLNSASTQQPPHNPYYPDLGPSSSQHFGAPPAYNELTRPGQSSALALSNIRSSAMDQSSDIDYSRMSNIPQVHNVPGTVIIQQPEITYDRKAYKYHERIKRYNMDRAIVAFLAIFATSYSISLYRHRKCVNYLVDRPFANVTIYLSGVCELHQYIILGSFLIFIICLLKCCTGKNRSYSCYLFVMVILNFIMTLVTGYIAYLAFFSPCALGLKDLVTAGIKTGLGAILKDPLPAPDKGVFNEPNVFQYAREDGYGVIIFLIDLFSFIAYVSGFLTGLSLC